MKAGTTVTTCVDVVPPADMTSRVPLPERRFEFLRRAVENSKNRIIARRRQVHIASQVRRIAPAMNSSGVHPVALIPVNDAMPPITVSGRARAPFPSRVACDLTRTLIASHFPDLEPNPTTAAPQWRPVPSRSFAAHGSQRTQSAMVTHMSGTGTPKTKRGSADRSKASYISNSARRSSSIRCWECAFFNCLVDCRRFLVVV
jgi:hypothetical protein